MNTTPSIITEVEEILKRAEIDALVKTYSCTYPINVKPPVYNPNKYINYYDPNKYPN